MKQKYCETIKPGYYYLPNNRCLYVTGTTKGNKWINLASATPKWGTLMWNCIEQNVIDTANYSLTNPI